jgi:hypothetical protein
VYSFLLQAWLRDFFSEGATVAFYIVTGFKFRPGADNPYIQVGGEDDEGSIELGEVESADQVAV